MQLKAVEGESAMTIPTGALVPLGSRDQSNRQRSPTSVARRTMGRSLAVCRRMRLACRGYSLRSATIQGAQWCQHLLRAPPPGTDHPVSTRTAACGYLFAQVETARGSGLPKFVKDEFDAFLECGILADGFLRLRCGDCAHEQLPSRIPNSKPLKNASEPFSS
jgi:hypothetical protein